VVLQVYSTVRDLAKLASLFMVGQDERKNVLGIYSSTLREMLTPSFVNDEQVTNPGPMTGHGRLFDSHPDRAWLAAADERVRVPVRGVP
jgi:hypothetical protein